MSESYAMLAQEVATVVGSAYPCSLKRLRDIVVLQCNSDVSEWAAANPCSITPLTRCLLQAVRQQPYVMDIITKLSFSRACRDAFLHADPALLHHVIPQAIKNDDSYIRASIALLSHPLPSGVPLPADVQRLFVQLMENAAQHPSAASVAPVHAVLKGTGSILLAALPHNVLSHFEEQMLKILRSSGGPSDQCLSLYCLSIMNVVCSITDPGLTLSVASFNTQDMLASTPCCSTWKSDAMQQYLTGNKAEKSVQLVVLLVMLATKKSAQTSRADDLTALILANDVISSIPPDIRLKWCAANSSTVRKLQERFDNHDLDDASKVLALRFMGSMCEWDSLQPLIRGRIESTFFVPCDLQLAHLLCGHIDYSTLSSSVFACTSATTLLDNAVDFLLADDTSTPALSLDALLQAVEAIHLFIMRHPATLIQVATLPADKIFARKLQNLKKEVDESEAGKSQSLPRDECHTAGFCATSRDLKRSRLVHQICRLMLEASLKQRPRDADETSVASPSIDILLDLFTATTRNRVVCHHESSDRRQTVLKATFETPEPILAGSDNGLSDWRQALQDHCQARAEAGQRELTTLFERACAGLEARCEDVEQPLKEEQDKRHALELQNADLRRARAEIEDRDAVWEQELRALELERTDLLEKIKQTEQTLRNTQAESERCIEILSGAKQIAELRSASVIAKRQEELEELQEQLDRAKTALAERAQLISALQTEVDSAAAERDSHRSQAHDDEIRMAELQRTVLDKDELITSLRDDLDRATSEQTHLRSELAGRSRCIHELETLEQHSGRKVAALGAELQLAQTHNRDLEQRLATETMQHQRQIQLVDQRLLEAKQEYDDDRERFSVKTGTMESRITGLQNKVSRLQHKCDRRDERIAEAETMRVNLTTAIGLPPTGKARDARRMSADPSRHSHPAETCGSEEDEEDATPPTPASEKDQRDGLSGAQQSFESSNTSKSGPTPKRPRPRKSVVAATPARSRISTGARATRSSAQSRIRQGRQPLQDINGNQSRDAHAGVPDKYAAPEDIDETTFDGGDLFTGTQGAHILGLQESRNENT